MFIYISLDTFGIPSLANYNMIKFNILGGCFGLREKRCSPFTCHFDGSKADVDCCEFCDGHDGDIRWLRTGK